MYKYHVTCSILIDMCLLFANIVIRSIHFHFETTIHVLIIVDLVLGVLIWESVTIIVLP